MVPYSNDVPYYHHTKKQWAVSQIFKDGVQNNCLIAIVQQVIRPEVEQKTECAETYWRLWGVPRTYDFQCLWPLYWQFPFFDPLKWLLSFWSLFLCLIQNILYISVFFHENRLISVFRNIGPFSRFSAWLNMATKSFDYENLKSRNALN